MTEINFYVSRAEGLEHRLAVVYRLVNIALQRNLNIHIHTGSEAISNKIDDYLWSKESTSFIPHSIVDIESTESDIQLATTDRQQQIIINEINISHNYEPLTHCDYLINMSSDRPTFFSRFLKVAEILDNNEEIITAGRKRYSFYRDRGYTLGYHKL